MQNNAHNERKLYTHFYSPLITFKSVPIHEIQSNPIICKLETVNSIAIIIQNKIDSEFFPPLFIYQTDDDDDDLHKKES